MCVCGGGGGGQRRGEVVQLHRCTYDPWGPGGPWPPTGVDKGSRPHTSAILPQQRPLWLKPMVCILFLYLVLSIIYLVKTLTSK